MSAVLDTLARVDSARLKGWSGPSFPPSIDLLNDIVGWHGGLNIASLGNMLERMDGFTGAEPLVTDDEHLWSAGLAFTLGGRRIMVAIPSISPASNSLCRSAAVYTDGHIGTEELDAFVRLLADWLGPSGS
ncbi:MAG TPA: hypothetical protein VJB97_03230 [Candidatus Paceibacterota bacterium]